MEPSEGGGGQNMLCGIKIILNWSNLRIGFSSVNFLICLRAESPKRTQLSLTTTPLSRISGLWKIGSYHKEVGTTSKQTLSQSYHVCHLFSWGPIYLSWMSFRFRKCPLSPPLPLLRRYVSPKFKLPRMFVNSSVCTWIQICLSRPAFQSVYFTSPNKWILVGRGKGFLPEQQWCLLIYLLWMAVFVLGWWSWVAVTHCTIHKLKIY